MAEESALHEVSEIVDAPSERAVRTLISEWRGADLITSEQADALTAYHREHHLDEERSRGFGRTIALVSSLGALLVGAGILLVVGSNWQSFTPLAKTAMAMVAVVAFEAIGYAIRFGTGYHRTGEAILFVGAAAYGGAIFLVAQTYNRPVDDPNLFLFWLLAILPLAYVVRSRLIMALAIVVTYGVIGYRLADWTEGTSSEVLAVATTYLVVGAATVSIGGVHRDVRPLRYLAPPWEWFGTASIVAVLFVSSFRGIYDWSDRGWIEDVSGSLQALLVVAAFLTGAGIVARTAIRKRFDREVALTASITGLAMIASAVLIAAPFSDSVISFAVMNLILLAMVTTLVVGGVATGRQSLVNIALVVFAVAVVARYIEIGAGMLGTGAAMIVGGALLIGLGVGLERFRRSLVTRMRQGEGVA